MNLLHQRHNIVRSTLNPHDGTQRADKDLTGEEGADNRHAIAPVEAQWQENRLDPATHHTQP